MLPHTESLALIEATVTRAWILMSAQCTEFFDFMLKFKIKRVSSDPHSGDIYLEVAVLFFGDYQ